MKFWSDSYEKARSALSASPVLAWGSVLIAALVLIYPLVGLWDALVLKRQNVAVLAEKLHKIEAVKSSQTSDWKKRTRQLESQHEVLFNYFRSATSAGLVKVDIRKWLEQLISKSNLNARVALGASELKASTLYPHWRISATISGQGKPKTVLPLIREIEEGNYLASLVTVSLASHSYELLIDMIVLQESQEQE